MHSSFGATLTRRALQIARSIDPNTYFKVSNGWLDSFKNVTISNKNIIMNGYQPQDV